MLIFGFADIALKKWKKYGIFIFIYHAIFVSILFNIIIFVAYFVLFDMSWKLPILTLGRLEFSKLQSENLIDYQLII